MYINRANEILILLIINYNDINNNSKYYYV